MAKEANARTGKLFLFLCKRERIKLPVWIVSITLVTVLVALAFDGLYETATDRQYMAETMENPAMIAMVGKGFGLDDYTIGSMLAHQMLVLTGVAVGIMSILLVVRLTRADEEEGQLELMRALPVGRLAQTNAAILLLVVTNVILALVLTIGLGSLNIESIDWFGSFMYGSALGVVGLFFGAVTLFTTQLSDSARGSMMLAYLVLAASYMIRAVGDAAEHWVPYLSPLGLVNRSAIYVDNHIWPLIVVILAAVGFAVWGLHLQNKRDIGSGLLPQRAGRSEASRLLKGPFGLSLKLLKTSLIAWAIGMLLIGSSYGSVLGDLDTFLGENEMIMQVVGGDLEDGGSLVEHFLAMLTDIIAIVATIPALTVFFKMKAEEKKERSEPILATRISRTRWLSTFALLSFVTSVIMLTLGVVSLAGIGMIVVDDLSFVSLVEAQLIYLPAMWVLIGFAISLYGWIPKLSIIAWFYLLFSFFTIYLGDLLEFPEWLMKVSSYQHIPELFVEEVNWITLIVLFLIGIGLSVIGWIGYLKRDIEG
ncbi:ABC-2 type transport system permease protein [Pelagirhabdus alkalitolerans]|uniref:ABC-2 type transport system permease protein n=1 Tax=Pelagirhabdus alkalitolerans TaxID=1612202 RepID=A0A1G6JNQ4_9BACI|nr:ABC transporter permease [Pelagirhabdus alkalitolerans]SDC20369.1 ABC-2 type transport system permease protein [Pelagirhabdus alkalitolerans]